MELAVDKEDHRHLPQKAEANKSGMVAVSTLGEFDRVQQDKKAHM